MQRYENDDFSKMVDNQWIDWGVGQAWGESETSWAIHLFGVERCVC